MDIVMFLILALGALLAYFGTERVQPLAKVFLKRWGIGLGLMVFAVILGGILMPNGPDDEEVVSILVVGAIVLGGMTTMLWALIKFGLQYYSLIQRENK